MSKFFALIATVSFAVAVLVICAATVFSASPVNVTISPEVVNVTVEQEGAPTVTVSTTVGEVMNVITAGEQGIPGAASTVPGPPGSDGREIELQQSVTHIQWRYLGEVAWLDLVPIAALTGTSGTDGTDGREIELQTSATHIQWRYAGDTLWIDLLALAAITGAPGADGLDGADGSNGRDIELQTSATHIQWRAVGDIVWLDLVPLSSITGADGVRGYDGREIELQLSATHIQWRFIGQAEWTNLLALADITGTDGNTYSCFITGGVQTLTFDKNGSNPAPTMVAFAAEMRENGTVVTPACSFTVPASGSLLSGSSAICSFTPTVAGSFSAGAADNRVNLVATYNGITCQATAPVAVTKIGADGLPADPETKAQLYTKIGTSVTGDVLNTSSGPADADGFAFRNIRINGNIHRADLVPGKTVIYSQSTDTADTIKLEVRKPSGATAFTISAGGALVIY
jgi:hypothetical protein